MKKAYYFSEMQKQILISQANSPSTDVPIPYREKKINGKVYTEVKSHFEDDDEIQLKNAFPDSVLVHVETNCPLDECALRNGFRSAK